VENLNLSFEMEKKSYRSFLINGESVISIGNENI
jgi:hypothetical protein